MTGLVTLTDVPSALASLIVTLLFVRVWRVTPDPDYMIKDTQSAGANARAAVPAWQGWLPWLLVSVTVILWGSFKLTAWGQLNIHGPGLHNAIASTLYHDKAYAAIWSFQPLATGTAVLVACLVTCVLFRVSPAAFLGCVAQTLRQTWLAVITVMLTSASRAS